MLAGDFVSESLLHNAAEPLDTNDDDHITPIDVLIIANYLSEPGGAEGEDGATPAPSTFPDVDGDAAITPTDAHIVTTYLNTASSTTSTTPPPPPLPDPCASVPHPSATITSIPTDVDEMEVFTVSGSMPDAYIAAVDMGAAWVELDMVNDATSSTWSTTGYYNDDIGSGTASDSRTVDVLVANICHQATVSTTLTVHNVDPTITINAPSDTDEGSEISVTFEYADAENQHGIVDDTWDLVVDWGDGNVQTITNLSGSSAGAYPNPTTTPMSASFPLSVDLKHTYADDNPSGSPQDANTITATITDDDTGTDTQTATIVVKNVAPTVTIDSITAIDKVLATDANGDPTDWLNAGQLDESEGFKVTGTVTDPGVNDTFPTAKLEVDLNFNGTIDTGESINLSLNGGNGTWTFDNTVAAVADDGPWLGNGTLADDLGLKVLLEDDDAGAGSQTDTVVVWDVPPTIIDDPEVHDDQPAASFQLDSQGNMTSATVNGAFHDPGNEDEHEIIIEWGDGGVTIEVLSVGDRAFSVKRVFQTNTPMTPEELEPIIVYVYDDDGLFDVFVQANNACQDVTLPAYTDKVAAAASRSPWNPTGHLKLTWNHFTPLTQILEQRQPILAFTKSPFPAHPDIVKRVAVLVEHEGMVAPAGDEEAFKRVADPHWAKLREYKLTNDEAHEKAREKFVKHTGTTAKRCWITVAKFSPAEVNKIVKITLDTTLPNGTRRHRTNLNVLLRERNGATKVANILKHEQGHHDISEAYAKVLRAELMSMRFAVWSPVPNPKVPDKYRDLAAKLLRQQALPRLRILNGLVQPTNDRYEGQSKSGNRGDPTPRQLVWDQALADTLAHGETDPNAILVQPVEPPPRP